jgi:hypothetical protein
MEVKVEKTKMKNDNVQLQTNYAKEMEEQMNDVTDLKGWLLLFVFVDQVKMFKQKIMIFFFLFLFLPNTARLIYYHR